MTQSIPVISFLEIFKETKMPGTEKQLKQGSRYNINIQKNQLLSYIQVINYWN